MITEELELLGCGVAEHDESCLCDVVITKPLPPLEECFKDAVAEMFMGKELCEIKDYCAPWTNEKILSYLEDMRTFYDEFHSHPLLSLGVEKMVKDFNEPSAKWWARVCNMVQHYMDNTDSKLVDIIQAMGLTPQEFIDIATHHNAGDGWDKDRLNMLDSMFSKDVFVLTRIAKEVNITVPTATGLRRFWIPRRMRNGQGQNKARVMLGNLALDPAYAHLSTRQICDIVNAQYGTEYTNSLVSKIRNRTRARQ
jgi:hypothetical protein